MSSENAQAAEMRGGNSNESFRGGDTRSSEEAFVMTVERRGIRIQLRIYGTTAWEDFIEMGKPFNISKQAVYEAYKRVKANRGSAGVDNITMIFDPLYRCVRHGEVSVFDVSVQTVVLPAVPFAINQQTEPFLKFRGVYPKFCVKSKT